MTVEEIERGPVTVLALRGEYDTPEVPRLASAVAALAARGRLRIVLSLEGVTFVDSTALGSFIREHERIAQAGGELCCAALSRFTAKNFRLLGMDRRIRCFATADEAVAALAGPAGGGPPGAGGRRVAFRFPDEGSAGRERHAEVLEIREDGISFRLDDLEGIDPAAQFPAGRALEVRLPSGAAPGAGEFRAAGRVDSAEALAGRRIAVRASLGGLSGPDREALGRLARDLRYDGGGAGDPGDRES